MTKSRDLANAATALNAVTATELGFVDGVTSAIQTQIDTKLATATAATTYVANSLADAKGDIFVATADNTVTRLPVGNSGEQIVADSSTSTGLRYTAGTVQANPVLNSAMQVWQRSTSTLIPAASKTFVADRWEVFCGSANMTVSRQLTGDTTNLPNVQYVQRIQRTSGSAVTSQLTVAQNMETVNSIPFAGKTITFSFYARKGANFSSSTIGLLNFQIVTGTGTDQNIYNGYTGPVTLINTNFTLTTSMARYSVTVTVPTDATELSFYWNFLPTGTAGAADYFDFTAAQIDIGSVALPFRTYAGTIQGELAACQRYYYQHAKGAANYISMGAAWAASQTNGYVQFPVTMRTAPTMAAASGTNYYIFYRNNSYQYINTILQDYASTTSTGIYATGLSQTAGDSGWLQTDNASSSIAFSAEL